MTEPIHDLARRLRITLGKMDVALNSIADAIVWTDTSGQIQWCNKSFSHLIDRPTINILDSNITEIFPLTKGGVELSGEQHPASVALRSNSITRDTYHFKWNEKILALEIIATSVEMGKSDKSIILAIHDVTVHERAYHIQRILDEILNISLPPLSLFDILKKALDEILSISSFSLRQQGAVFLYSFREQRFELATAIDLPKDIENASAAIVNNKCICGNKLSHREINFICGDAADGDIYYDSGLKQHHYCVSIMVDGKFLGVLTVFVDKNHACVKEETAFLKIVTDTMATIIERKMIEKKLKHMAYNDSLTGLPNRPLFLDRLRHALSTAKRHEEICGILYIDLDHFKTINDTLGHDAGDLLLCKTAERLRSCVRDMDTVARIGGDEFTIILQEIRGRSDACIVGEKIMSVLSNPFHFNKHEYFISASIGIAIYPSDGLDCNTLIRNADCAMYSAKQSGKNQYRFFGSDDTSVRPHPAKGIIE